MVALWVLFTFGFCGCVHERIVPVQQVPVKVPVPMLIVPDCSVPNSFEMCKVKCLLDGLQPIKASETADTFDCQCVPFDS